MRLIKTAAALAVAALMMAACSGGDSAEPVAAPDPTPATAAATAAPATTEAAPATTAATTTTAAPATTEAAPATTEAAPATTAAVDVIVEPTSHCQGVEPIEVLTITEPGPVALAEGVYFVEVEGEFGGGTITSLDHSDDFGMVWENKVPVYPTLTENFDGGGYVVELPPGDGASMTFTLLRQ